MCTWYPGKVAIYEWIACVLHSVFLENNNLLEKKMQIVDIDWCSKQCVKHDHNNKTTHTSSRVGKIVINYQTEKSSAGQHSPRQRFLETGKLTNNKQFSRTVQNMSSNKDNTTNIDPWGFRFEKIFHTPCVS
jgi:hypothetical protein